MDQDHLLSAANDKSHLKAMGLSEHLGELRVRMTRSVGAVVVFFVIAFSFADDIMNYIKLPLMDALPEGNKALHFTGPMDVLVANMKLSFLAAIVLSCPVWLYHFWKFLEPALYQNEKKYILPFIVTSISLFTAGVCFCFFVMVPITLEFLIGYGLEVGTAIITITDYVSLLMILIFGFGIVFETPLIIVLLALLDLVSAQTLKTNRKIVLIGTLVLAALLTPPDPISQMAMAIPTYLMYEIALWIVVFIKRNDKESTNHAT